jgi:hypothetical protein
MVGVVAVVMVDVQRWEKGWPEKLSVRMEPLAAVERGAWGKRIIESTPTFVYV